MAMSAAPPLPAALIARAARCWRTARDTRQPVQQHLHALLAPLGYEMMAPVIDSLMTLGEACLDRPLCRGCPFGPDADAALLCALLADPARLDRLPCRGDGRARHIRDVFAGALTSARVMAALA
ncbi:hypothetical protein K7957_18115 [Sphingomonas yunnanensis]|uniref:hypothetical protein n=1 Tax=Sphingomonas yunnanensis TaxID=310400 RepID=UPI001CA71576|nr:hypothetical protein [Sphingomonas yunnanensis]MBY9064857.1 hypothetical protein [Sphingomonas yunnanensis]